MKRLAFGLLIFMTLSSSLGQDDLAARAEAAFASSFAGGDPAVLARVSVQDEVQRLCSEHRNAPPGDVAQRIVGSQRAAIRYPANLIGNWRDGKRIAEDFTGLRYSDKPGQPAGGNCYACHQVAPQELAYGNVGPSLLGYGKALGSDMAARRLVYERIYNSQAFIACSAMPRFGHNGVLTPEQIAHLVAWLLDPASEVNQ
jgi:sulfur-oxidizing protein SoxX